MTCAYRLDPCKRDPVRGRSASLTLASTTRARPSGSVRAETVSTRLGRMMRHRSRKGAPARSFFDRPVLEVAPDCSAAPWSAHTGRSDRTADHRGRGVRRPERPRLPRLSRTHRPQRRDVRSARPRLRLLHLRHVALHQPGLRSGGPGQRNPAAGRRDHEGAGLARKHRPSSRKDSELAKGPARLATALGGPATSTARTPAPPAAPFRVLTGSPSPPARSAAVRAPASPARGRPPLAVLDRRRPDREPLPRPRAPQARIANSGQRTKDWPRPRTLGHAGPKAEGRPKETREP